MTIIYSIALVLFVLLCLLTCLLIMIQESKSMGLGASFGGEGEASLFGTGTADILKKFTAYLVGFFMVGCIVLSLWTNNLGRTTQMLESTSQEIIIPESLTQ